MADPLTMRAAVLTGPNRPLEISDVQLDPPSATEVLVRIHAAGVCASDLHVLDGDIPEPFPLVLGHEAAGEVVAVGPDTHRLHPGDHVVLSITPSCGACVACDRGLPTQCAHAARQAATGTLADGTSRLSRRGERLHHFNSVSAFAEYAVVPESATVAIPRDVPWADAALISCGVLTGVGAVWNLGVVSPGQTVGVWGCGGIGLSVIQAARIAGAKRILAIDRNPDKLALAVRLGATDGLVAGDDLVDQVIDRTGGGLDVAFDAVGSGSVIGDAWSALATSGTVVALGILPKGSPLTVDAWGLLSDKAIKGSYFGSAQVLRDVPRIIGHYRDGSLDLAAMVSHQISLDDLPAAFDRLRAGRAARQVVVFPGLDPTPQERTEH